MPAKVEFNPTVAAEQVNVPVVDAVVIGVELTIIVDVLALLTQPAVELPETVYIVVTEGDNMLLVPEPDGLQV